MSTHINGLRRSKRIAAQSNTAYTCYIYDGTNGSTNNRINNIDRSTIHTVTSAINNTVNIYNGLYTPTICASISIIKHYLDQCDVSIGTENKCAAANKLFEYLIANTEIYTIYPRFRVGIKAKINELRNQLKAYQEEFDLDTEAKALIDTMTSIKDKIHNRKYSEAMQTKLDEMKSMLYDYNHTIQNEPLMNTMNTLELLMEKIKMHPNYVPHPTDG